MSVEPSSDLVVNFSKREKEVARLMLEGLTDQDIADQLFISINIARTHIKNVYKKLGISTRSRAILELCNRPQLLD